MRCRSALPPIMLQRYTRPEKPSVSSSSTDEVRDDTEEKAFSDLLKYILLEVMAKETVVTNDRAYLKA